MRWKHRMSPFGNIFAHVRKGLIGFSLPQELDFEMEAKNIFQVREYFEGVKNTPLVIPNGNSNNVLLFWG